MLNANDFKKKQIIFLFTNAGEKLSFSNDNIVVKDKEGKIKCEDARTYTGENVKNIVYKEASFFVR